MSEHDTTHEPSIDESPPPRHPAGDEPEPPSIIDQEPVPAGSEGSDALARLRDPSQQANRRAEITRQVRDRSRLQWVPASELLRGQSMRAGEAIARFQEAAARAGRSAAGRSLKAGTTTAREGIRRHGTARPISARNTTSQDPLAMEHH